MQRNTKPEDWCEGRYQYDRSFLWNLIHYKRVNYARLTSPGESEDIAAVINTRFVIVLSLIAFTLSAIVGALGG